MTSPMANRIPGRSADEGLGPDPLLIQEDQRTVRVEIHGPHQWAGRVRALRKAASSESHEDQRHPFDGVGGSTQHPSRLIEPDPVIDLSSFLDGEKRRRRRWQGERVSREIALVSGDSICSVAFDETISRAGFVLDGLLRRPDGRSNDRSRGWELSPAALRQALSPRRIFRLDCHRRWRDHRIRVAALRLRYLSIRDSRLLRRA